MAELMRLRIPNGWTVSDNKFYDTDPIVDTDGSGFITNWYEGFTDDVLWIQECKFDEGKFYTPDIRSFHIDISWLPGSYITGNYIAKLQWCTDDELITVESVESKNRFEVRDKMEFWMSDIFQNYQDWQRKMLNL